ncbi:hypothetical protein Tco_0946728 [Tanacetum coccineum]
MAPKKRTTRSDPATITTPATTFVTNAQLQAMIDQGVTAALAARDAIRSTNGEDSHNSGTGVRRNKRATQARSLAVGFESERYRRDRDNQRFQELALVCVRMFPKESDKIERYVGGLPDMIHGSVVASKPKTMQEETEIATELMDKRIRTFTEHQTENKRKQDNNQQQQQPQNKRQNIDRAYAAGTGEKKLYGDLTPMP